MSLRARMLLTLALLPVALIAALYWASQVFLLQGFARTEESHVRREMDRAGAQLSDESAALRSTASDYATWDDTYAYVGHPISRYVEENLNEETFRRFRLTLVVIADTTGRIVLSRSYDPGTGRILPGPEGIERHLNPGGPLLSVPGMPRSAAGLVELPGGVAQVAAQPILTSAGQGPIRGTLVIGRALEGAEAGLLRQRMGLPVVVQRLSKKDVLPDLAAARSQLSPRDPVAVRPLDDRSTVGYAELPDLYGKPCVLLRLQFPRLLYRQGQAGVDYFILSLVATAAILGAVTWMLIERGVLRRVEGLSRIVKAIGQSSDPAARVPAAGKDEISGLSRAINGMLASLEQYQGDLQLDEERLQALLRLHQMPSASLHEITHFTLEEAVRLTRSSLGYLAFLNADETTLTMHAWSSQAMAECAIKDRPLVYEVSRTGLWGEAVRRRKPVITNDYEAESRLKKGIPAGHVPLRRHMNVPVFDGERIVALVGVGNKEGEYDDADVRQLALLAGEMWQTIQRQRMDAQMRHAQKLESLGVLAGGIAHDFNNLLSGILGNAGLAQMKLPEGHAARAHIDRVEAIAMRAGELANQMLAYSGKGRFVVEPIDFSRLVEEMLDFLRTVISKKAELRLELTPGLPPIEGDASQIRQVVMNLITNASDALAEGTGTIRLRTALREVNRAALADAYVHPDLPEGPCLLLEVSDTGCGMDAATRARIFDPFFSTKFTGRGLGLAAVLGIVRGHHGAVHVSSQPGRGTSFQLFFPIAPTAVAAAADPGRQDPPNRHGAGTLLVADDEETVREVAAAALKHSGFEVLLAADGQAAVELFGSRSGEISAVLLDLTMPRMGGDEALREMRRIRPDLPVLLSSGYSEQEALSRIEGGALVAFIQKPYRPAQLIEAVCALLAEG